MAHSSEPFREKVDRAVATLSGSPTKVMICCRRVQSTRLLQCDSLMTSRKTTSFVLTATLAVLVCC